MREKGTREKKRKREVFNGATVRVKWTRTRDEVPDERKKVRRMSRRVGTHPDRLQRTFRVLQRGRGLFRTPFAVSTRIVPGEPLAANSDQWDPRGRAGRGRREIYRGTPAGHPT